MCFVSFAQIHPFQRPCSGRRMINQFQDQNMLHKVVCFRHLFLVVIIQLLGYERLEEKGKCLLEKGHEQMYIVYWAQMCSNIYICNIYYTYIPVFQCISEFLWVCLVKKSVRIYLHWWIPSKRIPASFLAVTHGIWVPSRIFGAIATGAKELKHCFVTHQQKCLLL